MWMHPVQILKLSNKKLQTFKGLLASFETSKQRAIRRRNTKNYLFYPGIQLLLNTKILGWIYDTYT